jgi:TetR/AcrR family transcriptional regulator, transcriptional repressor for nem operon
MGEKMTKGEQTRQRVVQEAAKLFNQRGYEGSSLQDIMEATGLEKGGIYRHFSSKDELAEEAFKYAWSVVSQARSKGIDELQNPLDQLRQFVRNFIEIRPGLPGGCPLLNTAIESDDGNPVLRKQALAALRNWRSKLTALAQSGIEQGSIRRHTAPETVAIVIISCLEGALMMSRLERDNTSLLRVQEHLSAYLDSIASSAPDR